MQRSHRCSKFFLLHFCLCLPLLISVSCSRNVWPCAPRRAVSLCEGMCHALAQIYTASVQRTVQDLVARRRGKSRRRRRLFSEWLASCNSNEHCRKLRTASWPWNGRCSAGVSTTDTQHQGMTMFLHSLGRLLMSPAPRTIRSCKCRSAFVQRPLVAVRFV